MEDKKSKKEEINKMGKIQLSTKPSLEFFELPIEFSGETGEIFLLLYSFCWPQGKIEKIHEDHLCRYFYANNIIDKVSLYFISRYKAGIYLGTVARTEEEARDRASIFIENFNRWHVKELKKGLER
jgi:hypothetical protein